MNVKEDMKEVPSLITWVRGVNPATLWFRERSSCLCFHVFNYFTVDFSDNNRGIIEQLVPL